MVRAVPIAISPHQRAVARFAANPVRKRRYHSPETNQHRARKPDRSASRESFATSRAPLSTIYTFAPEEPGLCGKSIAGSWTQKYFCPELPRKPLLISIWHEDDELHGSGPL